MSGFLCALRPLHGTSSALAAGPYWLTHGPVGEATKYLAAHTGLPLTVVVGAAIVLSLRLIRRAFAVFVEIGLAVAALATATRFGWITW